MQTAMLVLMMLLVPGTFAVMTLGSRGAPRRRGASATTGRPRLGAVRVVSGEGLFLERIDAWTVGLDALLPSAEPGVPIRMPVHLRLYCPLVRGYQATALVASLVGRWSASAAPLAVEVVLADGRTPRARLSRAGAAVVLDIENGEVLRLLAGRSAVAGSPLDAS